MGVSVNSKFFLTRGDPIMTRRLAIAAFILSLVVALLAVPSGAQAQVTLSSMASPGAGSPGLTTINITGSNFPAGTISPSSVTVTLTPSGGGAATTTTPSAVTTILGTTRRVTFVIPGSISVSTSTVFKVTVSGTTTTGTAFSSTNYASLTINPPAPTVQLSNASLTFANQVIGTTSAAQTITVNNSGTSPLTIASIALTGTNPAEYKETNVNCPISPSTLAVGGTCTVQVSFQPLAVGTRTANVTFTDNSGGAPGSQQNVGLTGTASAATPTVTTIPVTFNPGSNVSGVATLNCPSNTVPCTDPNAHSLKVVVNQVNTAFTLTVTTFEVSLSEANGVCESGKDETNDFDCRFKTNFSYQTQTNGDVIVPQCIPVSNGNCVYYRIGNVPPGSAYQGPVFETISWNNNAYVPSSFYQANNPRLFDDPDAAPYDTNHQFVFDITDFFNSNGNHVGVDPTISGHTKQYNDFVVAFPSTLPNPAYTFSFVSPLANGSSSFQQGTNAPISFTLTQGTTPITNALTSPNAVAFGLTNANGVRQATLAPDGTAAAFTYNATAQQYVLTLATQNLAPGTYTVFVNSNLFLQQSTTFTITPAPLQITTTSPLQAGSTGVFYSQTFAVTGGTAPYTWAITGGTQPAGLTLSSTGVLSGTPSAAVVSSFTVKVTDAASQTLSKLFSLSITTTTGTPTSMTANPGTTPQSAKVNTAFATPLGVTVKDSSNNPVSGVNVTFTAPGSGASGVFSNGTATITVATNASGIAAAPFTANAMAGGPYTVTASATGLTTINFILTNSPVPTVQLSNASLTFANQVIGTTSAAQTITVNNSGTSPLTIASIALTGTNPAEYKETNVNCPISPSTLAVGGTCTVQVSFQPLAVGTRTANVTFTDNSGGAPGSQQNVGLTGTASAATPTVTTIPVTFNPGSNVSGVATLNCPSNTVPCTDPNAHSLKVVVNQVNTAFTLTVTTFEVSLSEANGVCESGKDETNDFDCRFKTNFSYQTQTNGDVIVPQCIPVSNGNCVYYRIGNVPPGSAYQGPVFETISWNNNAYVPSSFYQANNPRLFDDPDAAPYDTNHQFVFDITDFFNSNGNHVGVDPTISGHTKQYNDFVVAFPSTLPNPAYTFSFVSPLANGSSSFQQGTNAPISFTLTQGTTPITNALTSPNAVAFGLTNANGVRQATLAPDGTAAAFTYNATAQQYVLTLATQNLAPGTYTVFVNSNLFLQQSTTFTITPAPLQITTTSPLQAGSTGVFYSQTFAVTGGTAPYTWAITGGTQPAGLTLSSTGVLSGTPSAAVASNFTVTVTDAAAQTQSKSFALSITTTTGAPTSMTANPGTTPQSAVINTAFANPLAVTVKDTSNNPVSGVNVTFTAPGSGASGKFSNGTATITVATNSSGVASAPFTANATAAGPYTVTAAATGLTTVNFSLTNTAGTPSTMTPNAGTTPQSAKVSTAFANALAVTVKDGSNNPVPGVNVTFTAPGSGASGGFSNNTTTITVATNASGVAAAPFTANAIAGGPYTVTASATGLTSVNFSLTNTAGAASTMTGQCR